MNNDRFVAIATDYESLISQVAAIQGNDYAKFEQSIYNEVAKTPFITGRILDVGCGDGATSFRFIEAGCNVSGIDLNPEMISAYNQRFAGKTKAEFGDATDMANFALGEISVIITGAAIHNIPVTERVNFWKEVLRLAPKMIVMAEKVVDPDPVKHQAYYDKEVWAIKEVFGHMNNLPVQCQEWLDHYVYDERERLEFAEVQEALGEMYDLEVVYEMGMFKTIRGLKK